MMLYEKGVFTMTKKIICKNAIMTNCEPLKGGYINSRNFWNNKACIIRCKGGYTALQSYGTIVAVVYRGKFYRTWDGYSVTTMNHVNRFCGDMMLPYGGKAWWIKQPVYNTEIQPLDTKYYKAIYSPWSDCYYYQGFKIVYPRKWC